MSLRAQQSNLLLRTCHCERSEAISISIAVIASAAKQSPSQIGDCFSRSERSIAMTMAVIASAAKQSPFQLLSLRA
ncbi:MAG: hypothetical protein ACPL4H_09735, partial [Anaerolineales bacterium]